MFITKNFVGFHFRAHMYVYEEKNPLGIEIFDEVVIN